MGSNIPKAYDPDKQEWSIVLNKYQRDNLLWLLNAIGYPRLDHVVEPFNCANTGDWVGELALMLRGPDGECFVTEKDRPNTSFEDLRRSIGWAGWRKQ